MTGQVSRGQRPLGVVGRKVVAHHPRSDLTSCLAKGLSLPEQFQSLAGAWQKISTVE